MFGVLLVGAAVLTVALVFQRADQSGEAATPAPRSNPSATPLWSARRIPQVIRKDAAAQRFGAVIAGFASSTTTASCVAVDGPSGRLARVAATAPLAPASTVKLLTGAAALRVLGPDHVFTTVVASAAPLSAGVLRGDLYLVGDGDPVLSTSAGEARLASSPATVGAPTTSLDELAAAVSAAGIRSIEGAIVADDSKYDAVRYLPSLEPGERFDIGPLGALTVDDGLTGAGAAADDPALLTAGDLDGLLRNRGIATTGATRRGVAPTGARTVAKVTSPRLDTIVASMLTVSDNYTAEMLVRAIGRAAGGTGSTGAGLRGVTDALKLLGVPTAGLSLVDGSGLSHHDRVTCSALLAAVVLGNRSEERALRTGLAVAGRTGTLALRFVGDPLAGNLRAKTGHIDGVVGLAGVVSTTAGVVRFAFVANGDFSVRGGEDLQNQIAHLVASYPVVPKPASLVPEPGSSP